MKHLFHLPLVLLVLLLIATACKKSGPVVTIKILPTITSISPVTGPAGTSVTITGTNFKTTASDNIVKFNGTTATVTSATATTLVVTAPAGGTTGAVSVSTSDGTANGPTFTYIVPTPPTISGISPTSGPAGTIVTITGTNFKTTPTDNTVQFNGVAATVQSATASTLTVVAPASGSTGAVTVSTSDGTASGPAYTYTVAPDLYVVGLTNSNTAAYWKNGTLVNMPSNCLRAYSIYVSGTDVYVAGVSTNNTPAYWKNGAIVDLPISAGYNEGSARSIVVSGTDVYVGGWDQVNGSRSLPKCWKNGVIVPTQFSAGNISNGLPVTLGVVYAIAVSGTDVYMAGEQSPFSGNQVATYWKNGVPVPMTDGTTVAEATGLFLSGSDVYVSGYVQGTNQRAYWKNGTAVPLTTPSNSISFVGRGVYVSPTADVYICGEYQNLAKFWKNGVMTDLTTTAQGPSTYESAFAITGTGSDVYIAGTNLGKGTGYWKNGNFTVLPTAQFAYNILLK